MAPIYSIVPDPVQCKILKAMPNKSRINIAEKQTLRKLLILPKFFNAFYQIIVLLLVTSENAEQRTD